MSPSKLWNLEGQHSQGREEGGHSFELPSLPLSSRLFPPCNVRMTSGARSSDAMTAALRDAKNAEIWGPRLPVLDLPVWLEGAIRLLQLSGSSSYLAPNSVSIQSSGRSSFKKFYWVTNRRAAVNLQLNGLTQKEVRLVHDNQSPSHHASKYTKHGELWGTSYTKTI